MKTGLSVARGSSFFWLIYLLNVKVVLFFWGGNASMIGSNLKLLLLKQINYLLIDKDETCVVQTKLGV